MFVVNSRWTLTLELFCSYAGLFQTKLSALWKLNVADMSWAQTGDLEVQVERQTGAAAPESEPHYIPHVKNSD